MSANGIPKLRWEMSEREKLGARDRFGHRCTDGELDYIE